MKKILTLLTINFILFLIFIVCAEAYSYHKIFEAQKGFIESSNTYFKKNGINYRLITGYSWPIKFNYNTYKSCMRPTVYGKGNKKPLLFFGCSFTQGSGLKEKQTLTYKISKLTNRTIYNRGRGGTGPQFVYYQLNDKNFKQEVPDAEYIIYTFIWDHLYRLYSYSYGPYGNDQNLRYKIVDNKLEEIKPTFVPFYTLFMVKKIQFNIRDRKFFKEEQNYELFNTLMQESIKIAQKKYPNSKFIILEYPDSRDRKFSQDEILKLKNMGYTVINIEKLLGHDLKQKKYRLGDDIHPSEYAWDEIAPKLVQKLKL